MARFRDREAYRVGNVEIITGAENVRRFRGYMTPTRYAKWIAEVTAGSNKRWKAHKEKIRAVPKNTP